ncbi:MAG: SUF system Fe-S cluster assembly protein [Candidatus Binatia bacterium]|jgi:FeS assembly SUF system protein
MNNLVIEAEVIEVLRNVFDPEIPVNIYELGLIYEINVDPSGSVVVQMTLTSPNCPVAQSLPEEVQAKVKSVTGVTDAKVEIVWEPPWDPAKMSDAAKLQLGML